MINHTINHSPKIDFTIKLWHRVFFEAHKFAYTKHDAILKENNVYPVDAYLTYWASVNNKALEASADQDLLILRTEDIQKSNDKISRFFGLSPDTINVSEGHLHKAPVSYQLRDMIDSDYLSDRYQAICGELIDRFSFDTFKG